MGRAAKLAQVAAPPLKLDLGCGPNKREGFHGVDRIPFVGVETVFDLTKTPWPWADGSVAEAHSAHFVEHLTGQQRVKFVNELYRVLAPGASCQIIVPHWASERAYGDFTHQWPPVSEFWFLYLNREWRAANAPHNDIQHNPDGYSCHFTHTYGWGLRGDLMTRNEEYRQFALANYVGVRTDTIATITKA